MENLAMTIVCDHGEIPIGSTCFSTNNHPKSIVQVVGYAFGRVHVFNTTRGSKQHRHQHRRIPEAQFCAHYLPLHR